MAQRLQKIMAHLGWGSRRRCEDLIRAGRVTLDGRALPIGTSLEPEELARLLVDGNPAGQLPGKRYLLLNKPAGYVTTVSDPQGRETVMALLPAGSMVGEGRLYPVGRLDRDTEGALLFTNDGELAHRLLHPSSGVEKEYRATVASAVDDAALERLRRGPMLEDGPSQPPKQVSGRGKEVLLVIKEGRKHQVRRMLKAVGMPCRHLERRRFANLDLRGLPRGSFRELTLEEIATLRSLAGAGS
jgi:23S rRNA pseudouridine2605 synthase